MLEIFEYDPARYPLADWAREVLQWKRLECLNEKPLERAKTSNQRVYYFTKAMKDAYHDDGPAGAAIRRVVSDFVDREVRPRLPFVPWLRILPNFRVHEAGQEATSKLHRDRTYLTELGSLKIWLPFVGVSRGGTLWVESAEGKNDLAPIALQHGQAMLFDSLNLLHGCFFNDSGQSRVSMDFIVRRDPALIAGG
ncbi:hypothetical protein NHU_00887 [Rhodovulum sulfidophilum]|uniref:Uncharacterized protein n=1 Tax=Rhodovulum sulfidophilum TaxID=35806 RepID=A0A0D6B020_RHOSU|nr:hypothetical protein NHU_00887 [Rhodovulum sulfidophilum]